ncbi:MAG: hypothetical protein M3Y04_02725, partial [Actinomycetota bacterium]|nr:hypothetical protein [Actinomycetota bacterium]
MSDRRSLGHGPVGGSRRHRQSGRAGAVLLLLMSVASVIVAPAAESQVNAISVSLGPAFPAMVTVGSQNQAGLLGIVNNSIGNVSTVPVTINNILLNPSCTDTSSHTLGPP